MFESWGNEWDMSEADFLNFCIWVDRQMKQSNLRFILKTIQNGEFDILLSNWETSMLEEWYWGKVWDFDQIKVWVKWFENQTWLKVTSISVIWDIEILQAIIPIFINWLKKFFKDNHIKFENADISKTISENILLFKKYLKLLKEKLSDWIFIPEYLNWLPEEERLIWLINLIKWIEKTKSETQRKLQEIMDKSQQ